jgi:SRSO17 transposase
VSLAYASDRGAAFIDRALYLPRVWTQDAQRCAAAGIPADVRFASKITLAEQMLARAFAATIPASWVVADSFYGRAGAFRRWLEERGRPYAVMIPRTNAVQYDGQRIRVEQLAEQLIVPASLGWLRIELSAECAAGMARWLLIHHDAAEPEEDSYWLTYGPAGTTNEELVRVCEARWQIEECFGQAKGEVGLDQYEVRTWVAWYRFMTLCLLAHAYLVVLRAAARQEEAWEKGVLSRA